MKTKFLSVKPADRGDSVSFEFVISFICTFSLVLMFFDSILGIALGTVGALLFSYIVFGTDRIKSMRFLLFQLRNTRQTANHKDTFYLGDDFFKVSSFEGTVNLNEDSE